MNLQADEVELHIDLSLMLIAYEAFNAGKAIDKENPLEAEKH